MSDDTLLLFDGLDQSIATDHDWALKRVEEIIQQSVVSRDAYVALNACKSLIQVSKISGLSLAKALYLVKSNWSNYDIEDEFEDVAYSYIGLHPHTVNRYCTLWRAYDKNLIPENVREEIQQQNVKQQIPIAMALEQGYEISDEIWQKLSDAPDLSSVSKILREDVKGQEPRKGSLQLSIDHVGTIWAFAEGNRYFVGSLEIDSEDEFIQKSIERIKKGAGIL